MRATQKGVSLMEVLISLLILSVGLLGLLKMQLYALQAVNSAFNKSIAVIRAESLRAILNIKPDNFSEYFANWQRENWQCLPDSNAEINQRKLYLSWFDRFTQKWQSITIKM